MASPFLWAVYCEPLLAMLHDVSVRCHIAVMKGQFYCDDLTLLALCRRAVVIMLMKAKLWAAEFKLLYVLLILIPNRAKAN